MLSGKFPYCIAHLILRVGFLGIPNAIHTPLITTRAGMLNILGLPRMQQVKAAKTAFPLQQPHGDSCYYLSTTRALPATHRSH
jgi:hypothetical protein